MVNNLGDLCIPPDIEQDICTILHQLCSAFGSNILKIILFGSYAKGSYQPDSDLDIVVVLKTLPELRQRALYTQAVDIDREVDLIFCTREQLESNLYVYKNVNTEGVVLYEQL